MLGGVLGFIQDDPFVGVAGAIVGMVIPLGYVSLLRIRRMRSIREELPVVIDMLARTTRAGQSIDQAIELCATESSGLLAAEFRQCCRQLEMGRSFDGVMNSLSARVHRRDAAPDDDACRATRLWRQLVRDARTHVKRQSATA